MITSNIFWAILGSTVVATIVGSVLNWIKENFQRKSEVNEKQFQELYGPIKYHLLALRALAVNRDELLDEIKKEPTPSDLNDILKKFEDLNPVNTEWQRHIYIVRGLFENQAGYIKKEHLKLVEDFIDGFIKRDITQGGKSARTTTERIRMIFDAIDALQKELL
jgi:hypothetical protein